MWEPTLEPESSASANSAISARLNHYSKHFPKLQDFFEKIYIKDEEVYFDRVFKNFTVKDCFGKLHLLYFTKTPFCCIVNM